MLKEESRRYVLVSTKYPVHCSMQLIFIGDRVLCIDHRPIRQQAARKTQPFPKKITRISPEVATIAVDPEYGGRELHVAQAATPEN